jgi:hypothetical protein
MYRGTLLDCQPALNIQTPDSLWVGIIHVQGDVSKPTGIRTEQHDRLCPVKGVWFRRAPLGRRSYLQRSLMPLRYSTDSNATCCGAVRGMGRAYHAIEDFVGNVSSGSNLVDWLD